jgi:hypothetical protein
MFAAVPTEFCGTSGHHVVHRHDNLVSLIKQTNLFEARAEPRKPTLRERLGIPPLGFLAPTPTDADRLNTLVNRLDKSGGGSGGLAGTAR